MCLISCYKYWMMGDSPMAKVRTVDFRNTVVIMTSNLGSSSIQENFGSLDYQGIKEEVMEVVNKHFRPEFINRVDESVVFHPLRQEHIKSIASIQLGTSSETNGRKWISIASNR